MNRRLILLGALAGWLPGVSVSRDSPQRARAASPPGGIHESTYVRIGGIDQWVQIRGDDLRNPVLLWLNGGPGESTIPSTPAFRSWERLFTVVMWDQRGEGKTFEKNGEAEASSMTIERMTGDGIELAQYLRQHLHQDKIVLLGHSWGSILGIHMIKAAPESFSVYVGTGQVTELKRQFEVAYPSLLARAMPNSPAARELAALGPPPWKSDDAYETVNKWAAAFDPPPAASGQHRRAARPTLPPPLRPPYVVDGARFSNRALSDAIEKEDLPAFATRFAVPIVFIQGGDDLLTTTAVVKEYFDRIVAPSKRFIQLPGAGHNAVFRDRDAFLAQLMMRVRPLAVERRR